MRKIGTISLFFILLLLNNTKVEAQDSPSLPDVSISFSDSVEQQENSRLINNNIIVKSNSSKVLRLHFKPTPPPGWRALSTVKEFILKPQEQQVVPLTLVPTAHAPASWKIITFKIEDEAGSKIIVDSFVLRAFRILRSESQLVNPRIDLAADDNHLSIIIRINNSGNVANRMQVQIRNSALGINITDAFNLEAQADTLLTYHARIAKTRLNSLINQSISVRTSDASGRMKYHLLEVNRLQSSRKQNQHAFSTLPVEIENGYIYLSNRISSFVGLTSNIQLAKERVLNFSYRSIEFGLENQLQDHVLNFEYKTNKLNLFAGQMSSVGNFANFGNGVKIFYEFSPKLKLQLGATLHTRHSSLKNNNFEANFIRTSKKISSDHTLAVNVDKVSSKTGLLFYNKGSFRLVNGLTLEIGGGIGIEKYIKGELQKPGYAFEYTGRYTYKGLIIQSRFQNFDRHFPGLRKGLRNQNHDITLSSKKHWFSVYYQSNESFPNIFRDSVYNTDVLSYNTTRAGIGLGTKIKRMYVNFNIGKFNQNGAATNNLNAYTFFETNYNVKLSKHLGFRVNSFNGVDELNGKTKKSIWISTSSAGLSYKYFSLSSIYTQMPVFLMDSAGSHFNRYQKALNITPALTLSVSGRFNISLIYGISKSMYDQEVTTYVNGRLGYKGKKNGLSFDINGMIPIKKSKIGLVGIGRDFVNVAFRKIIHVPKFEKRKYFDLKTVAFNDLNSNGIKEQSEPLLPGVKMKINGIMFSTSKKGVVNYKNVFKGDYVIDLVDNGLDSLIPAHGLQQKITITNSVTSNLPFKKSRLITGRVAVEVDSLSHFKFSPAGLKVIAIDSSGGVYSALCNEAGAFSIYAPQGKYLVSLNREAFDDKIRPDILSFTVDLFEKTSQTLSFIIRQQKRKIRFLN